MGRLRTSARLLPWLLAPLLAPAVAPPLAAGPAPGGDRAALRQGNRSYRQGDLEGAAAAYRAAADGGGPLLAYNLATTLHHLGRLPEAVLWYRRAELGLGPDPWLDDNLARARADLAGAGARRLGPPRLLAPVLRHPWLPGTLAALCAWAALAAALAGAGRRGRRPGHRGSLLWGLLGCGLALWVGTLALAHFGPFPAVLLRSCGELPAGSEVWVVPGAAGELGVAGEKLRCEGAAVGLVELPGSGPGGFW